MSESIAACDGCGARVAERRNGVYCCAYCGGQRKEPPSVTSAIDDFLDTEIAAVLANTGGLVHGEWS